MGPDAMILVPISLRGMHNDTVTLEYSLVVSFKTEHTVNIWYSNHISWCSPIVENFKNQHIDAYRTFIHNSQKLEASKMFFTKWMDK